MNSVLANSLIESRDIDYTQRNIPFSTSTYMQEEEIELSERIYSLFQIQYPLVNLFYSPNDINDISASSNLSITLTSKSETYDLVLIGSYPEEVENINIVNMAPIKSFNITLKIEDIRYAKPNVVKTEL